MKHWSLAGSTAALALFAGSANAAVTPEEVWKNWQDASAAYGQTMSAESTATEGSALVAKNVTITSDKDGAKVSSTIPEMRFEDKGDGTVGVTLSDSYTMAITVAPTDGTPPSAMQATVSMPGMAITASGTPDAVDYAFAGPSLAIAMAGTEGADAAAKPVNIDIALTNLSGHYLVGTVTGGKSLESSFAADSMTMAVKGKDESSGGDVAFNATVATPAGTAKGNFVGIDMANFADALKAGFAMDAAFTYGAASYQLDAVDPTGPTKIAGTSQGGALQVAMDAAKMLFAGSGKGVSLSLSGPEIPFPEVKLSYAESGFNLLMPVSKGDAPQDFAFGVKLIDAAISDEIWGMIDPTAQLPHDPATVAIDTKGKVKLLADLTDEAAMNAEGAPPPELHALDIGEVHAKIAGAELTGAGAFTFDNTDMMTFGGVPAPTGKIDLKLVGGNTLLDKLVAMGLLSEDDANGARMMASMFANPGAGADELTSTLEFKDKHFFANGQQLQ